MRIIFQLTALACLCGLAYGQSDQSDAHDTDAASYHRIVESKLKQTYPATAMRMLRECGNIREGVCIDIGCGTGRLDVELARRSKLKIIGLDIDPEMKKYFDQHIREAELRDRVRFVAGDAQQLPFPDDYADIIVSRGVLIFIPDLAKCLQEVERVLKPTGVAFLGGRYLYAPADKKTSTLELQQIVATSGVPGARVIDERGQWVKIMGPQAPQEARDGTLGPSMVAARCLADYGVSRGDCLLVCGSDNETNQELQRSFLKTTELKITALYAKQEFVEAAQERLQAEQLADRITCRAGKIDSIPFPDTSFDLVVGVGPLLIWTERQATMRELHRVLRPGGCALVGGRYLQMPESRKVSSETLRADAQATGIPMIRILDDMGQWVEIRKPSATGTADDRN